MIRIMEQFFTAILLCGFLSSIAVCQQQNEGPSKEREYAQRLIRKYDSDKDEMLSAEEVSKMRRPFRGVDANKDGFVSEDEIVDSIAGRPTTLQNQNAGPTDDTNSSSSMQTSFTVKLTEYRMKLPQDPSRSASEILAILTKPGDNDSYQPIETIRLSALSGTTSTAQFGRTANVTAGTTTNRGGKVKNMQSVDVGTAVSVTPVLQSGKVALQLEFDSSRIEGDASGDSPPDISKTRINTNQLLELGKPGLVGSTTSMGSSIIVVTVTQN